MSDSVRLDAMSAMSFALLGAVAALSGCGLLERGSRPVETAPIASRAHEVLPSLEVRELLEPGAELRPTIKATALAGQRVRLVGFVAELELPLEGLLYLVPRPLRCDEAGGGTADLPPESVLVTLPAAVRGAHSHPTGLVEVIGSFEVGNRPGPQGSSANFRLQMEEPTSAGVARSHARGDEDG